MSKPELSMRAVESLPPRHVYYPCIRTEDDRLDIVLEVIGDGEAFPPGHRGVLTSGECGTSLYDWHREVPVDAYGVPHAKVVVVERHRDGTLTKTPYLAWCRRLNLEVLCGRCRQNILETPGMPCPGRSARRDGRPE